MPTIIVKFMKSSKMLSAEGVARTPRSVAKYSVATAPVVSVRMKEYVPLSYSYVVAVDYLDIMRKDFKEIYEKGEMTNLGLKAWD